MKRLRVAVPVIAVLAALTVLACEEPPPDTEIEQPTVQVPEPPAGIPAWVEEVATMANAIEARPAAADSILRAHDMTPAAFDSLLFEIAADPVLTAAYRGERR